MTKTQKIGIIGAGAWGCALALAFERAGFEILIWSFETDVRDQINQNHENKTYLQDHKLSPRIKATSSFADFKDFTTLLLVCPTQHISSISKELYQFIAPETLIIICSKGIDIKNAKLPSELLHDINPNANLAILSGPSFARDVALNLPTALTFAYADNKKGLEFCKEFATKTFRPYWSDDIIGAQIGGAIKNIIAIGCGIILGKKWGDNARAALITRGLNEMAQLSHIMGGKPQSLMGLAGIGDLTLTCNSLESRNMSLGYALGQGQSLADYIRDKKTVCEGLKTVEAIPALKAKYPKLNMPTCEALYEVLIKGASIDQTLNGLLSRPIKEEILY